jgi:hypothetical protein
VASYQDDASAIPKLPMELFESTHFEAIECRLARYTVERAVAGQETRGAGGQFRPERLDRVIEVERIPRGSQCSNKTLLAAGTKPDWDPSQNTQDRIATGRPEKPEQWQEDLVEDELPAQSSPD